MNKHSYSKKNSSGEQTQNPSVEDLQGQIHKLQREIWLFEQWLQQYPETSATEVERRIRESYIQCIDSRQQSLAELEAKSPHVVGDLSA